MADPTPFLAAVAWGLIEGSPFDAYAERVFRRRLNRELAKHKLYMVAETAVPFPFTGRERIRTTWYLYARPNKRRLGHTPAQYGTLRFVAQHAYTMIHGNSEEHDNVGAAVGECSHSAGY